MKNVRPAQEDFVCQSLQTSIAFDKEIVPCNVVEGCSQTDIDTETEIEAEQEVQAYKLQLEAEVDSLKHLLAQKDAKIEYYQS